ncbi:MAG: hypothetical protein ACKVT1_04685 [Dehalococcoidia bacterium]
MSRLTRIFIPLFFAVVIIQGIHVFEHIVQLAQVYLFGVSDDDAFGLLGYVFKPQNTEEWLHLGFNGSYLAALYLLLIPLLALARAGAVPWRAFAVYAIAGVGLESWHVVEHAVIISNVVQNNGCPCPGIGDRVLGVTDTQLHFVYNAIAYAATVVGFWFALNATSGKATDASQRDTPALAHA